MALGSSGRTYDWSRTCGSCLLSFRAALTAARRKEFWAAGLLQLPEMLRTFITLHWLSAARPPKPRAMRVVPGVSEGDAEEVAWCARLGQKRTRRLQWGDA